MSLLRRSSFSGKLRYFCFQGSLTKESMEGSMTDESYDINDQSTASPTSSSVSYCRTNSELSTFSDPADSCSDGASPVGVGVPPRSGTPPLASQSRLGLRRSIKNIIDRYEEVDTADIELEMMKERFSKLLLGEDMSGGGKGVSTAMTISNAITNLYATIFGNALKLEPLKPEKKTMWKREMECLLSVCDSIVEFLPQDENGVEVMCTNQRTDIQMNLPALKKLDGMLLDILDSFQNKEFWYAEQGKMSRNSSRATSFRNEVSRKDEKWWLPVPCIPSGGVSDTAKKHLRHQRDCASQIHKAAMAINNNTLNEMEVPESYITGLPKSGKSCLGDALYKYMYNAEVFSPDHLLDTLKVTTEREALELADKVEASLYTWKRKSGMTHSRSWQVMKEITSDADRGDKNYILADRAETLLFSLKHRFPGLSQTTLDTCKIQYNRDVGQAILESYSRVLEGLAYNLVSWINDVMSADKLMKNQEHSGT